VVKAGDLINIDVSAELDGHFGDTGASFAVPPTRSLVRNLASHGVGRSLHDEPAEIPTWYEPRDRRTIPEGLVFTIEPFLSLGADWVEERDDGWSLRPPGHQPTVQYEHTLVATSRGPLILTLA
jgi:methionyl aminopeptidase